MPKKERMKNGLDILFEDNIHENNEVDGSKKIVNMRISLIEPDKNQPRTYFNEEAMNELADNISQHGVLQPILVRKIDDNVYRIVAGERRWRAARMAGLDEIPVIVKELSDSEAAQISLIENLQREDLSPLEEAKAYKRLMEEYNMTQEQVAKVVGKSRAGIANSTRLLNLPIEIQNFLENKDITAGHAKILCGISDKDKSIAYAEKCILEDLTVRELDDLILGQDEERKNEREKNRKKKEAYKKGEVSGYNSMETEYRYEDPFYKFSKETTASFRENYGLNMKIYKTPDGKISVKVIFDTEKELYDSMKKLSEKL